MKFIVYQVLMSVYLLQSEKSESNLFKGTLKQKIIKDTKNYISALNVFVSIYILH